jgi:hypothetical protein
MLLIFELIFPLFSKAFRSFRGFQRDDHNNNIFDEQVNSYIISDSTLQKQAGLTVLQRAA